jgi:hypothetical protein
MPVAALSSNSSGDAAKCPRDAKQIASSKPAALLEAHAGLGARDALHVAVTFVLRPGQSGKRTVKPAPPPGRLLAVIVPPWAATIWRAT